MPTSPNYPDVLGAITPGQRLNLDAVDLALALDPTEVLAGRPFDALLLIQNNYDCEVDAQVRLILPDKDLKGARGRFSTKADKRIVVGLLPSEVGYVSLPALSSPQTAPGSGYSLQIEVEIKREARKPQLVRDPEQHQSLEAEMLPEAAQQQIAHLKTLLFAATTTGRPSRTGAMLSVSFTLAPPGISPLAEPNKAGWRSLWTLHDNLDESDLAERVRPLTATLLPQFTRNNLLIPLVRATQAHAERAGYRLWAGEAVMISKLITLVLESGLPPGAPTSEVEPYPSWFLQLCRLLAKRPDLAGSAELLATDLLYGDLIYEAALTAFTMVKAQTTEDLGSPQEMAEFAAALRSTFNGEGDALDFIHLYLPLVLGGILSNSRVMMPKEMPLDSLELIVNSRIKREAERSEGNQFVFDLTDHLLDRALAQNDTSLQRYLDPIERMRYRSDKTA